MAAEAPSHPRTGVHTACTSELPPCGLLSHPVAFLDWLSCFLAGFAVVLFDDVLSLARHRPPIQAVTTWAALPYMFGVAIYCFEVLAFVRGIECPCFAVRNASS